MENASGLTPQQHAWKTGLKTAELCGNGGDGGNGDPASPRDDRVETKGYCRNGGRGNGQWRSSVPSCVQGQEDRSNVHLGSVREPMDAME